MGLYEVAKDALKVAQKADNLELVQKLMDVQAVALDMQDKQQKLQDRIFKLEKENSELTELKKYVFANNENYFIDPSSPDRHLCPVCTSKLKAPVPLDGMYCHQCKGHYEK